MLNNNLFTNILFTLLLSATSAYGMEVKHRAAQAADAVTATVFDKNIPQVITAEHMPDGIAMPDDLVRLINEYHVDAWDYPHKTWLERDLCFKTNMQLQTAIQLSDGRIAIGTSNGEIYIFDIANKTRLHFASHLKHNNEHNLPHHQRTQIETLVELPNNRIFLRSYYNVCEIWDISTLSSQTLPQLIKKWRWLIGEQIGEQRNVVALPNNIVATHALDSIILYSAEDGSETRSARRPIDNTGFAHRYLELESLIKLSDTILASGSSNGTDGLIIWDLQTHNGVTTPVEIANIAHRNQAGNHQNVAFLQKISDTLMLSTAGDDKTKECALRLWDISDPRHPVELSKTIIMGKSSHFIGHYIQDVILVSPHVIAAHSRQNQTIYFYDISNPTNPHQLYAMPFVTRTQILPYHADQFISIEGSKIFLHKTNQEAVAALARLSEEKRKKLYALIGELDTTYVHANVATLSQEQLDQFNALPAAIKQVLQSHHPISFISIEAQLEVDRKAQIACLPFIKRKWAEFAALPTKQKLMVIGGVMLAGAYAYSKFKKRSIKVPSAISAWRFLTRRRAA